MDQTSNEEARLVKCPVCDTPQEAVVVTVLRPEDEAMEALFANTLNCMTCPECGEHFMSDTPVLFRDDAEGYIVYLLAEAGGGNWRMAEARMKAFTAQLFAGEDPDETPEFRLVGDHGDFIEKIALHSRGLDDRVVEYVKYQFFNNPNFLGELNSVRHRLLFDFSLPDEENLVFLVFDRETNQATARTHLPLDDYQEIAAMFHDDPGMGTELEELFPGYFVSVERLQQE